MNKKDLIFNLNKNIENVDINFAYECLKEVIQDKNEKLLSNFDIITRLPVVLITDWYIYSIKYLIHKYSINSIEQNGKVIYYYD